MKLLLYMLFLLSVPAQASTDVFGCKDQQELELFRKQYLFHKVLREDCLMQQKSNGLLWACYLGGGSKISKSRFIEHCKQYAPKINSLAEMPPDRALKFIPQACQEQLSARAQILRYKGLGF